MNAIKNVLELLCRNLDDALRTYDPHNGDRVILSNLTDHEGRPYTETKNKVVMTLISIQHDTTISTYNRYVSLPDNKFVQVAAPVYINLLLLFFANFYDQNYAEGLEAISRTISHFQQRPTLTHSEFPELDSRIDKLALEIVNLDLAQTNHILGMLGVKCLPAVCYRLRMIPFHAEKMQGFTPGVVAVSVQE
ncbi:MAG TPA: Pvc16 family protein [Dongiaceae bacterium]|jgi:hypothetical protein|nr:Pvc16 family protein [Dongiaceae bacterium]